MHSDVCSVCYLIDGHVDGLFYCDVHGVGLRDGHLDVLRHGHGHGVRDGHAHVACDGHLVRVRALRVRVLHLMPDVSAATVMTGGGQRAVARHCEDRQLLEMDKISQNVVLCSLFCMFLNDLHFF